MQNMCKYIALVFSDGEEYGEDEEIELERIPLEDKNTFEETIGLVTGGLGKPLKKLIF